MSRSRLSRRQQKRMLRQSVFYLILTVIIAAVFIFIVMPGFVQLADVIFNKSGGETENQDQVPPPAPVLSALISATNSAMLPVNGVGEAGSKAVLILNGKRLEELEIDKDGKFKFRVPLTEGENVLVVYSLDEVGNESVKTREYDVKLDTQAPEIELEYPQDGEQIELRKNQIITVTGMTEAKAKVFINDRLVYAREDGSFSMSYKLEEGDNTLKFRVLDQGGNTSEKEIKVNFRF